jgi:hypothetical protein
VPVMGCVDMRSLVVEIYKNIERERYYAITFILVIIEPVSLSGLSGSSITIVCSC